MKLLGLARPIRTARRHELVAEAKRLGVKHTDRYSVEELRLEVAAQLVSELTDLIDKLER